MDLTLSDHCPIIATVKRKPVIINSHNEDAESNVNTFRGYVWNEVSKQLYQTEIHSVEVRKQIENINELLESKVGVHEMVNSTVSIFHNVANTYLKIRKDRRKKRRNKKKWFDMDCSAKQREVRRLSRKIQACRSENDRKQINANQCVPSKERI